MAGILAGASSPPNPARGALTRDVLLPSRCVAPCTENHEILTRHARSPPLFAADRGAMMMKIYHASGFALAGACARSNPRRLERILACEENFRS